MTNTTNPAGRIIIIPSPCDNMAIAGCIEIHVATKRGAARPVKKGFQASLHSASEALPGIVQGYLDAGFVVLNATGHNIAGAVRL